MERRVIFGLIAGIAAMLVAIGMLTTLVPLHAAGAGFDPRAIGWIAGAYYTGFLIGPLLTPRLVARLGMRGAFTLAAALATLASAALPFALLPIGWAGLRLIAGIGFSILYILVESGLNAQAGNANRGRLLSVYLVASKAALVSGQLAIGLVGVTGWMPFALAGAMVALAAAIHATAPAAAVPVVAGRLRPRHLARVAPLASFGCLLYGVAEGSMFALGPLFARANGFAVAEVSAFMSAFLLGGGVAQWPLGALSDRIDRRLALLIAACGTIATALALGMHARPTLLFALPAGFALGAMMLPVYGLCVALANDGAAAGDRVALGSWLVLAYAVGAVAGPPGVAALMQSGARALPLTFVALFVLLAVTLLAALRHRALRHRAGLAGITLAPDLAPSPAEPSPREQ